MRAPFPFPPSHPPLLPAPHCSRRPDKKDATRSTAATAATTHFLTAPRRSALDFRSPVLRTRASDTLSTACFCNTAAMNTVSRYVCGYVCARVHLYQHAPTCVCFYVCYTPRTNTQLSDARCGWRCRCCIQITAKLCEEILGGVADGTLELHESEGVLGDALHILASKEIKLSAVRCDVSRDAPLCLRA